MTDFSKAVIYGIYCKDITVLEIYIGSTHDKIEREREHNKKWNNENYPGYNYKVYQFIRANGGMDNWIFEVIQEYPCDNDIQLRIHERYHYDLLSPALNTYRPYITEEDRKEECRIRSAKWYQENIENMKKYYKDNIEEIQKKQKQKFTCDCGIEYTQSNKARHCDSKRHNEFLAKKMLLLHPA